MRRVCVGWSHAHMTMGVGDRVVVLRENLVSVKAEFDGAGGAAGDGDDGEAGAVVVAGVCFGGDGDGEADVVSGGGGEGGHEGVVVVAAVGDVEAGLGD